MHILPNRLQKIVNAPHLRDRLKSRRDVTTFFGKLRDALRCVEDQWSLECLDGEYFEEVEIEEVADGHVAFRHSRGRSRILLSLLSEKSMTRLFTGFPMDKPSAATATAENAQSLPQLPQVSC